MKSNIFIAGSGGIGQAAGLILLEFQFFDATIYFGDVHQKAIDDAIMFVKEGCSHPVSVYGVLMPKEDSDEILDKALQTATSFWIVSLEVRRQDWLCLQKNINVTMPILLSMYKKQRM
jgi:hypothetical protein